MELSREFPIARIQSATDESSDKQIRDWEHLMNLKAPDHDPVFDPDILQGEKSDEAARCTTPIVTGSETSTDEPSRASTTHSSSSSGTTSLAESSTISSTDLSSTQSLDSFGTTNQPLLEAPESSVIELEKGVFASPTAIMEPKDLENWKWIKIRLQDIIINTFRPKKGLDPSIALEFMMAGPSVTAQKPAVLLVCCNEPHRKQLKKIIKSQKHWLSQYQYYFMVVIDKLQTLSGGRGRGVTGQPLYTSLPANSSTLCGGAVSVQDLSPANADAKFTVGGILLIDRQAFGITVAHAMQTTSSNIPPVVEEQNLEDSTEYSDDGLDDSSPFVAFDDVPIEETSGFLRSLVTPSLHQARAVTLRDVPSPIEQSLRRNVLIGHLSTTSMDYFELMPGVRCDWALIKIEEPHRWTSNTLTVPASGAQLEVKSFAVTTEKKACEVWINAGFSGMKRGFMTDGEAYLHLGNQPFQARRIVLDEPLVPGDSGSWVISDGELCGHIIASRESRPWVYMLPIEYILQDLKICLGVQDIRLPVGLPMSITIDAAGSEQPQSTLEGTMPLLAPAGDQASRRVGNAPKDPAHALSQAQQSSLSQFPWQGVRNLRHATKGPGTTASHTLSGSTIADSAGDSSSQDDSVLLPQIPEWAISIKGTLGPACTEPFEEKAFADYIRSNPFANEAAVVLGKIYKDRDTSRVTVNDLKSDELEDSDDFTFGDGSSAYAVYLVKLNNSAQVVCTTSNAFQLWGAFREANQNNDSVGRITFLQAPTELSLAVVHFALQRDFDMNEVFQHLMSREGGQWKTQANMHRAFEPSERRRRTFFFVFKYYTVFDSDRTPAAWLQFDNRPSSYKSADRIDIVECTSVLALSLAGVHPKPVLGKRRKGLRGTGQISDILSPWHLLHLQFYPDKVMSENADTVREFIMPGELSNGPIAFLRTLIFEYKDAVTRYTNLHALIRTLITPPGSFMFDTRLRDRLLFEDEDFTYSRRYFWAYNTLGVLNEGIKAMISAVNETFDEDFWAAKHATLWPHPDPSSAAGHHYVIQLRGLRDDLESAVAKLEEMQSLNQETRHDIKDLRDQLFNGSSVKESRRSIEQADNIKALTIISMMFLPLIFVTSVFGITNFDISPNDWRFPVTMVAICLPFFFFILVVQTNTGMKLLRAFIDHVIRQPVNILAERVGGVEQGRAVARHGTAATTSAEARNEAVSPRKAVFESHSRRNRSEGARMRMGDIEEGEMIY